MAGTGGKFTLRMAGTTQVKELCETRRQAGHSGSDTVTINSVPGGKGSVLMCKSSQLVLGWGRVAGDCLHWCSVVQEH